MGIAITKQPYAKPAGSRDPRPWFVYTLSLGEGVPVLDASIGLLLGEVIQNFRSALDHLAWAMVPPSTRNGLSAAARRRIYFPVARNRQNFWGSINTWLPDTSFEQRALIECYQPYRRTPKGRLIRRLRNLSDIDKHRIIIPAVALPFEGEFEVTAHHGKIIETIEHRRRGEPVKPGARLYAYVVAGAASEMTLRSKISVRAVLPRSVVRPSRGDVATSLRQAMRNTSLVCAEILTRIKEEDY